MTSQDLKKWRLERNLTQGQIAALFGIGERGYQKRESGTVAITQETVWACCYLTEHPEAIEAFLKPPLEQPARDSSDH